VIHEKYERYVKIKNLTRKVLVIRLREIVKNSLSLFETDIEFLLKKHGGIRKKQDLMNMILGNLRFFLLSAT
jgi:hypothetical protein